MKIYPSEISKTYNFEEDFYIILLVASESECYSDPL